ncbi:MAG: hypothetical protein IPO21_16160 [Bacteroidales bacterium]|nr:hypothetical protein [Bacteroidales bacterium]
MLLLSLCSCNNDKLVNLNYKLKNETGKNLTIIYSVDKIVHEISDDVDSFYGGYIVELENLEEYSFTIHWFLKKLQDYFFLMIMYL